MIPKIIHKILIVDGGKTPEIPFEIKVSLESFPILNPGYSVRLYNGEYCRDYIKTHFEPDICKAFDKVKPYAARADLARLCFLYKEGGYYSDAKQMCLIKFESVFKNPFNLFCVPWRAGRYHNAFIASVPEFKIIELAILKVMKNVFDENYGLSPWDVSSCLPFGLAVTELIDTPGILFGRYKGGCYEYQSKVFIKHKTTNLKIGDWSEIRQTNNYLRMWTDKDFFHSDGPSGS